MVKLSGEKEVEGVELPVAGIELDIEDEGETNYPLVYVPFIFSYIHFMCYCFVLVS